MLEEYMRKEFLFKNKEECCGCEACANVCPKGIISICKDNEGFTYPKITDSSLCIGCNKCEYVCPIKNADKLNSNFDRAYAGWCKEENRIITSSSGGFAAAVSELFVNGGGIVYGAAYTVDCYSVEYLRVTKQEEIYSLNGSKYIQAHKKMVYKLVAKDLNDGYNVLFIGLPCDTYAIKRYIGSNERLTTISLICHGPTSELVHKRFLNAVEKEKAAKVSNINLRYKKNGKWKPYYIHMTLENGTTDDLKFDSSEYGLSFIYFKRPSCQNCSFRKNHFAADILIGDYHSAQKGQIAYNKHGVSSILPLTEKGVQILDKMQERFLLHPVDLRNSLSQQAIHSSVKYNIDREDFLRTLNDNGLASACRISSIRREQKISKKRKHILKLKIFVYRILHGIKLK